MFKPADRNPREVNKGNRELGERKKQRESQMHMAVYCRESKEKTAQAIPNIEAGELI